MTLKIKKLTIENFRGVRLPLTVDFTKGSGFTSALIYGMNGCGKSSIVDAWEWLNDFKIESLGREGISQSDYPHRECKGKGSYITVEFQHPTISSATATFNERKITTPTTSGEYSEFRRLSSYPNFLRYADLQNFVYKTKAERYKYIAKFFGLEQFTTLQDNIQAALKKQMQLLDNIKQLAAKQGKEITGLIKTAEIDEANVLGFINETARRHGLTPVTSFSEYHTVIDALTRVVSTNPVAKELSEWQAYKKRIDTFFPVHSLKAESLELEKLFKELQADEETMKQLVLSELYSSAEKIIPQLETPNTCPICDSPYHGDLLAHVQSKHKTLDNLKKKKAAFDAKKRAIEQRLSLLTQKLNGILSENNAKIIETNSDFFERLKAINEDISKHSFTLSLPLANLKAVELSTSNTVVILDLILSEEGSIKSLADNKVNALTSDENAKRLAKDYGELSTVTKNYSEYVVNIKKAEYLSGITENLNSTLQSLTLKIQTVIQQTFDAISADVVDYFDFLESTNSFIKNPKVTLTSGKDKAVELEIDFVSVTVNPAFKFMSESQVNSFGLAIFLAAVKHFNSQFKFFILDDVVNSFDAFKRPKVAQLLASRFSDFQVLVLTHDQIFFDTMQRDFPSWQRYKITSWDYYTGPRFKLSKSYFEE
ncbi:MAG: AAA family ATPase, partial [Bacteroidetes bacterium]|nr:AAA family ATPase [Bacteroidota bacterium]